MQQPEEINCIIIEDERPASAILEMHIARLPYLQLRGTFSNTAKALPLIHTKTIDLIFLDINLPGVIGTKFAKELNASVAVIFTTAYTRFAVEGFELNAVDYLLKPISFERFIKSIIRYLAFYQPSAGITAYGQKEIERPFIFIRSDRRMVKIFLDDILYLEAQGNYVLIYCLNEILRTYQSITEMEEKLPEQFFIRVHRSFIISIRKIKIYNSNSIIIREKEIPVGRYYASGVEIALKKTL